MNNNNKQNTLYDVIIIGAGPAGMSAALTLGRAMINALVVNEASPRNLVTQASHGFLTQDGVHPTEIMRVAIEQLQAYDSVVYCQATVTAVAAVPQGFEVTYDSGESAIAKRIIFATGFKDDLARVNMNGLAEVYGKSVYPCPFCDGWELKGQPLAIFAAANNILDFTKVITHWAKDVVVFSHGQPIPQVAQQVLNQKNIPWYDHPVKHLLADEGILHTVVLMNGEAIPRVGGFIDNPGEVLSTELPVALGVKLSNYGAYDANFVGETAVSGVYIIGDAKTGFSGVAGVVAEGNVVGQSIVYDIMDEQWYQ